MPEALAAAPVMNATTSPVVRYRDADGHLAEAALDRVAATDLVAGRPVRDFRFYRGRRHYSGWYWSSTMGAQVAYESRLELARILLADFDPRVVGIAAQPFQLVGSGPTTKDPERRSPGRAAARECRHVPGSAAAGSVRVGTHRRRQARAPAG